MSAEHTGELAGAEWRQAPPSGGHSSTPRTTRQPQRRHSFDISLWRDLRDVSAGELRKHSSVSRLRCCRQSAAEVSVRLQMDARCRPAVTKLALSQCAAMRLQLLAAAPMMRRAASSAVAFPEQFERAASVFLPDQVRLQFLVAGHQVCSLNLQSCCLDIELSRAVKMCTGSAHAAQCGAIRAAAESKAREAAAH